MATFWHCVLVFVSAATLIHGQNVTLTFTRDNQHLDIRCAVTPDPQGQGQISSITSLTLLRVTGSGEEVIATLSSLPDDHTHSDKLGAKVTSGFSPDMTSESFVNLAWTTPTKSLDGLYKCQLDGFDLHNAHVEVKVNRTLRLTHTDPALTLTPDDVKVGLSRSMTLNCSVNDLAHIGMTKVFSIELKAVREGQGVSLATAALNKKNEIFPGSESALVTSHLSNHGNFLSMSWQHPQSNLTGRYYCDVNGLNGYTPVNFVRYVDVDVQAPTQEELLARIQDWEQQYQLLLDTFSQSLQETDAINASLDLCHKTRTFPSHCGQLDLEPGRYPVTLALDTGDHVDAMCEVEKVGHGWTVFQRRFDGSLSFDRNLTDYEDGFGSASSGEFWLGLDPLRALLGNRTARLRVRLWDRYNNREYRRDYVGFEIGEGPGYELTLQKSGSYSESYGLVEYGSGRNFSTPDSGPLSACASQYGGGWWMSSCGYNNLNARNHTSHGFKWYPLHNTHSSSYNLRESEMMFRFD